MRPEIEEFAIALVQHVRDRAIQSADRHVAASAAGQVAAPQWDARAEQVRDAIPDIVDKTVFFILNAIDQELLHLVFVTKDGATVDLTEAGLGELGGWFMGSDGWRSWYSKERFTDYFKE
jgi:hypothetical protein